MAPNLKFNVDVARNDLARAFLFENGIFKCDSPGEYLACVGIDGLSQDRGDITRIECPSPVQYGEFVEVAAIPGERGRMTTTVTGRLSRAELSEFYKLFDNGCAFDLHLHFGQCQRPDSFNEYDKALVFEDVYVTSFSTDPLAAIQSADRGVINESIDLSIGAFYEIVNLLYNIRGETQTVNGAIVSLEVCDLKNCGTCDLSNGCQKIFASTADGYVLWSSDGGDNWDVVQVTETTGLVFPTTVVDAVCYNDIYILIDDNGDFWYIDRQDLIDGVNTVFTQVASGLPSVAASMDTYQTFGVIVGAAGMISIFTNQDVGTTLIAPGATSSPTTEDLNDVYVGNDYTTVAVGNNGAVVYSRDGKVWFPTRTSPAAANLTAVLVKSKHNWIVGDANGDLWCTEDSGVTWSQLSYPGWLAPTAAINDLQMSSTHVLWMAQGASLFRSIDGGATWIQEPNTRANTFTATAINSIGACNFDVNFVLAAGEATDASGLIVGGNPA